jgi:predicted RecB family nuclease
LIARGQEHERAFLEDLRVSRGPIVEIPSQGLHVGGPLEEAARLTRAAMESGAAVIYQAAFFDGVWRGHADFLIRVESSSALGPWSYEPWDAKLSRETKASALVQLCAYAEMVEAVQGISPERVHVVRGGPGRPVESFLVASLAPYYRLLLNRILAYRNQAPTASYPFNHPYPEPVAYCAVCDWASLCEQRWRADDYLALVAGITGNQRRALDERGVRTLAALSRLPLPVVPPLAHTSPISVARVREQARLQREGRERGQTISELIVGTEPGMGLEALPVPSTGDIFFDIEGDPFVGDHGREYLFGIVELTQPQGAVPIPNYLALWAFDAQSERHQFEALVDLFVARRIADPGLHIYHFAPYEPSALKRLAARLGTRVEQVDELLRANVFVDLLRVVRQGVRASVESYSIKKLEPLYGFVRAMDLRKAGDARATLELWMETGAVQPLAGYDEICERVRLYNCDDCLSVWLLRDWLEQKRIELAGLRGADVPRPSAVAYETPPEVSAQRLALEALKTRLLDGLPEEQRTVEQQARWLTAQMLEWHWREDKSVWWDYFRMCELTDPELVEDGKPMGGIQYEGPVGQIDKSILHRYSFPEQEHGLAPRNKCKDPRQKETITIHALDEAARTFDIKRGKKLPAHIIQSLIPKDIVETKPQRASLQALGEWVADFGINADGDHRLARDLLLRVPPGMANGGGQGASLLLPEESPGSAAVRLVLELANSPRGGILPIQGPPGAGKTHAGAEMILGLVAAGFRVGVTANSHKVIGNLLKKTCELARAARGALRIAQKADEEDGLADDFVELIASNTELQSRLLDPGYQVFGGTSWLWSDCGHRSIDVLFVDEAGQMSLANVVSIAHAARVLVLLGDPMQLVQPLKGVHPPGAELSALEHVLGGAATMPVDRGLFLDRTWRLNPALCAFTSTAFYEGRLLPMPGSEQQRLVTAAPFAGAGIRFCPVDHHGNQSESPEEVAAVAQIFSTLLAPGSLWADGTGIARPISIADIVVLSPYNAQVRALAAALPPGARVGTVDKFQGQEAPVAIYSMATSTPEEAPRGMEFLYSLNRLNVATSRAQCLAIVVASPALLEPDCKTPRQMMQAAALCRVAEWPAKRDG